MELYAIEKATILDKRYEILSLIGTGGFSIIYKAYDHELNSTVAIKEYFPNNIAERIPYNKEVLTRNHESEVRFQQGLQSFREEAHRMAELNGLHNTVNVLGTFDENNTSYIVMELLEGTSLLAYLKTLPNNRFEDADDAKQIIYSVAEALHYAHSKKILHRDVSPDNIFLCNDGKVKLIDFGAAREITEDGELSVVVKTGCTPPEQYRKNGKQGPWTDLYALGATFYRMLTGIYPESAPDRADHHECLPPSELNPEVPEYINALILRCLAYDHTLRVANASEVMDVLHREKVIPLPGEIQAKNRLIKTISYGMLTACLVLFMIISLIVLKNSETLYTIKIDTCDIRIEIPMNFTSESGLEAVKDDFQSMYEHIGIEFITRGAGSEAADVFVYTGDTAKCSSLEDIQKVDESADFYYATIAYATDLIYWNVEKAFRNGIDMNNIHSTEDILPEYYADSYEDFLKDTNVCCAYKGSIDLYRNIQQELPGMYKIYSAETELAPVRFSVASGLEENQKNAAMRFLLYLMSERGQEILFINHEGLIPAQENQYEHFFEIYSELVTIK
ncbi:MAG: serine/threonine protein kinase [Oscillospiraceae bacterium]|nr:serine/threonine protein kinase [Oscillospiraceae bacterium]